MTLLNAVLLLIGMVLALVLFCAMCVWLDKKAVARAEKAQKEGTGYDERQMAAQGKASNATAVASLVYYGGLGLFLLLWEKERYPVDVGILVWVGLMVATLVYYLYCLMTDALLPLNKKTGGMGISSLVFGALMLVSTILRISAKDKPMIVCGRLDWLFLIYGICSMSIGLIYMTAYFRDKRAEK